MKQSMLDMMLVMMPYMGWIIYAGAALLAIGAVMVLVRLISGSGGGLVRLASTGLLVLGIFFVACQGAGLFLGTPPSFNFGDPTKFEFDHLYPFWQIGGVMLVAGIILRLLSGRREAM